MGNRQDKRRNTTTLDDACLEMLILNTFMSRDEILDWFEEFKV
jgi:hypothetical protein